MRIRSIIVIGLLGMVLGAAVAPGFAATQSAATSTSTQRGQFFIVSLVDAAKQQVLLKEPTEVTEVVAVMPSTIFLNEQGKKITLKDFHAGDTVFAMVIEKSDGTRVATSIRKGIMTVQELHRMYPEVG